MSVMADLVQRYRAAPDSATRGALEHAYPGIGELSRNSPPDEPAKPQAKPAPVVMIDDGDIEPDQPIDQPVNQPVKPKRRPGRPARFRKI